MRRLITRQTRAIARGEREPRPRSLFKGRPKGVVIESIESVRTWIPDDHLQQHEDSKENPNSGSVELEMARVAIPASLEGSFSCFEGSTPDGEARIRVWVSVDRHDDLSPKQ